MTQTDTAKRIAAIDLGSNSFHMLLAESSNQQLKVFHREKQQVSLARGLNKQDELSEESIERALQTLKLFAGILEQFRPEVVRIVGTFTFRTARNAELITRRALDFLPWPIEILSGEEEARLIYQGVSHNLVIDSPHLIVDIGGGSTEMVIGHNHDPLQLNSSNVGCVSLSERFFCRGEITSRAFKKAFIFAEQQFQPVRKRFCRIGWQRVLGTSGTIKAISGHLMAINPNNNGRITLAELKRLRDQLLDFGSIDKIRLEGVSEDRYSVICGGLATLMAVFDIFDIKEMTYCDFALREGLVADIVDKIQLTDVRDFSISQLCKRFNVDVSQAFHVEADALAMLDCAPKKWLGRNPDYRNLLRWACQLHEVGHHINHQKSHLHAHYIVSNDALSGFNQEQQAILAFMVLSQRKTLKPEMMPTLLGHNADSIYRLILLLRLGILINRFRPDDEKYPFKLIFSDAGLHIVFSGAWQPWKDLLEADLAKEQQRFNRVNIALSYNFSDPKSI